MQLSDAKRIVVKVGSALIADDAHQLRREWMATLAADIAKLRASGKQVVIVTSGAVALGRDVLGYGHRALELEEKQAAAACGQITLFASWGELLREAGNLAPAQILLTPDDSTNRRRYLNARNTLETILSNDHIVPIINENDTVATAELRFGDNDRLAARVAHMVSADLLVLLSDIDGLYTTDPRMDASATFIPEVREITPEIEAMAGGAASNRSSGGMKTKIEAARIALAAGCHTAIARGEGDHPLQALLDGGKHTVFISSTTPLTARKQWIAGSMHPTGTITVDEGAAAALKNGKSLLPAGVRKVDGQFERGDAVLIVDATGRTLGRGLVAYNAADATRIAGHHSKEIEQILGFQGRTALIHRDDMALEIKG